MKGSRPATLELNLNFDTINLTNDRNPRPHEVVFLGKRPTKRSFNAARTGGGKELLKKWATNVVGLKLNLTDSHVIMLLSANTTGAGVAEYDIKIEGLSWLSVRPEGIRGALGVSVIKLTHSRGQCHLT